MLRLFTHVAATSVLLTSAVLVADQANADPICDATTLSTCAVNKGGIDTGSSSIVLDRAKKGLDIKTGKPDKRSFEHTSVYACQFSDPDSRDDVLCDSATSACAGNTPAQGQGPMVRLFRRELGASGSPVTGWTTIGTTCFPEAAPGRQVLGLGQILSAFRNTVFAKPAAHIQPEGNITLVTLPTYFAATWPQAGFQPGEIDTVNLLGRAVRIRPTLKHYLYVFGDDTSFGPTISGGGPYPGGDITHAYPKAGTYNTHIDITYGGEFSVEGGAWITIPETATVTGPIQPVTVKTARSRLVAR